MKVVHVSLVPIPTEKDPAAWLKKIDFFTGQIELLTEHCDVHSVHLIGFNGTLKKGHVNYHFLSLSKLEWLFPVRLGRYLINLKGDVFVVHGLLFPYQRLFLSFFTRRRIKSFVQHHAEVPFRFPKSIVQKLIDKRTTGYFFTAKELSDSWVASGQISNSTKVHELMEVSSPFYPLNDCSRVADAYIWVGRLDENKDPETLLKAFGSFLMTRDSVILYVIYRGEKLLSKMEAMLSGFSDTERIILVGPVAHEELITWYNRCTFVIATSHYEGSGTAVCEAMSCGCIPVLSDIPSFRAMTDSGRVGLTFRKGDPDSLCEALVRSTSMRLEEERQKVLEVFRDKLSYEAIAKKMSDILKS